MLSFIQRLFTGLISFITSFIKVLTVFATLVGVIVCFFLFFIYLIRGQAIRALLCLLAMLTFVHTNKEY